MTSIANEKIEATEKRPPCPPFDESSAFQKVRLAENMWNSRNPHQVSLGYTPDTVWRNRNEFLKGREDIEEFLARKWSKELEYRLIKELFLFRFNRIAVRYAYEWHDTNNQWYRSYGNENWIFEENGLMKHRYSSINDVMINENERLFHWPMDAPRPPNHPSLSELGL